MSLDIQDKKYIDEALERNLTQFRSELEADRIQLKGEMEADRIQFKNEMEVFFHELQEQNRSHMTALKEGFEDQVRGLAELIQERPTESRVREIVREEVRPVVREEIYLQLGPTIVEIKKMVKNHEKRLIRLETARA